MIEGAVSRLKSVEDFCAQGLVDVVSMRGHISLIRTLGGQARQIPVDELDDPFAWSAVNFVEMSAGILEGQIEAFLDEHTKATAEQRADFFQRQRAGVARLREVGDEFVQHFREKWANPGTDASGEA